MTSDDRSNDVALAPMRPLVVVDPTVTLHGSLNLPSNVTTSSANNNTDLTAQKIPDAQGQISPPSLTHAATNVATSPSQDGFWQRRNNVYTLFTVSVGLVMTFVGFKISRDSYRLSAWTSKKDFIEYVLNCR
jgi:hypothetical protein